MTETPGTSVQDGTCQAAPETKPEPTLGERLSKCATDAERGNLLDAAIRVAEATLKKPKGQCFVGL
jgi:hypothetical protein